LYRANAPSIDEIQFEWWQLALVLAGALVFQSTIAPHLLVRGTFPSLVCLIVVWFGLRSGTAAGAVFGLIAGLAEDALGTSGAAWTVSTAIVGALAGRLGSTAIVESLWLLVPTYGALGIMRFAIFSIAMKLQGTPVPLIGPHWHAELWRALFESGIALALLQFVPRLRGERVDAR